MFFSAPAFLWGLLALAIPVAVHLFNFRRYRKVYFSNVDRLAELHTESRRSSTVRQWVVLALRCLAIAALVLAFARPVLRHGDGTLHSGATVVSIYVDNSFSMESASGDGSQLDAARRKVREIVEAYSVGDRYQLMTSDMSGEQMRWLSRDELLELLGDLQPSPASPMLSEVVARQRDFMRQSGAPNQHAYVVSDFQQSVSDVDLLTADSLSLVTLVPLGGIAADNVYIDSLTLDAPAYFRGGVVTVDVTLRNDGTHDVEKLPLRLHVDGRERAIATVDLAAGAVGRVPLQFTLDRDGWVDGCVQVEDYPVTFDDSYHFTLCVGQRIRAVEVGKKANPYLGKLFGRDSAVDYSVAASLPQLDDYGFVVLNDAGPLPSGEAQQLAQWLGAGGTLLVVPAADVATADLNALLALLGAPRLDRWVERVVKATAVDYDASLYRGVFGGRSDEMEMPTVRGHYMLSAQGVCQNIVTLADGGALLAAVPCGEGRLYLLTAPLDGAWSDFVSQALFVPTVYNMALYSSPQPAAAHTLGTDEPVVLRGSYDPAVAPPTLSDTTGFSLLPDLRRVAGRQVLVPHGELRHAGIYTLADEHLAFNYSRRESQLSYLYAAEVADAIDGKDGLSLIRNADKHLGDELRSRDGGRPLWHYFVLLALLALAAETLVIKGLPLGRRGEKRQMR